MGGLLCRASGQGVDHLQLFADDVTRHCLLSTRTVGTIDSGQIPSFVILELGCTKSIGSLYAMNKFMKAAHVYGLAYELVHSTSTCSCANSETTPIYQAIKSWFPTTPPMFTVVDIVEQGRVPILFLLHQMKNLHINLDMRPDRVLITCEAFGLHHVQATQASSSHIVIVLAVVQCVPARATSNSESNCIGSFVGDSELACGTCLAGAGRHRPHTYAAACKKATICALPGAVPLQCIRVATETSPHRVIADPHYPGASSPNDRRPPGLEPHPGASSDMFVQRERPAEKTLGQEVPAAMSKLLIL